MKLVPPPRRDVITACVLYSLNIFDAISTIVSVEHGYEEMNPLMDYLLQRGVGYFLAFKVIVAGLATLLLLYTSIPKRVNVFLVASTGVYLALAIYHILLFWLPRV